MLCALAEYCLYRSRRQTIPLYRYRTFASQIVNLGMLGSNSEASWYNLRNRRHEVRRIH